MLKKLGADLYQRVIVSYRSTLLGLLALAGGVAVDNFTGWLQASPHAGTAIGSVAFVLLALAKKKLAEEAAVLTLPPPKGFGTVRLLLGLALLAYAIGYGIARADDAQPGGLVPQAGACFKDGGICIQPALTVVPIVIDFRSGDVSHDVAFAFGYGVVFPKALTPSLVPGADVLGGTQTGGGWNAAFLLRLGVLRVGPVVTHKPGVTYAGFGIGTGV